MSPEPIPNPKDFDSPDVPMIARRAATTPDYSPIGDNPSIDPRDRHHAIVEQQEWEERRNQEQVNHPAHYGGENNPYEAIKVIEAWDLGFCLGNTVKYISRAGKKGTELVDLKKALWYLNREVERRDAEGS